MSFEMLLLIFLFFFISMIYASAGFGGGSSYLAILTIFPILFTSIRIIALLCNITVVAGSVYLLNKHSYIKWKKIFPLIILSIPLAFVGGRYPLNEKTFFILLSFCLFGAALIMLLVKPKERNSKKLKDKTIANALLGGGIGFLSGMVGIGGGIFLSPVLHTIQWAKAKIIAGTTAVFILVNSIAGITGQLVSNVNSIDFIQVILLMISVFIGGQIGIRISISRLSSLVIRRITGFLIMFVSLRLMYVYLI